MDYSAKKVGNYILILLLPPFSSNNISLNRYLLNFIENIQLNQAIILLIERMIGMKKLSAQSELYLSHFNAGPKMYEMEPAELKAMLAQMPETEIELPQISKKEDQQIKVSDGSTIRVRIYTPEGEGPFPIIVYYHGGGWVLGAVEKFDTGCIHLANKTKRIVVSVDYRLAPEYKFPVPLQDAYDAFKWVSENAFSFNGEANDIVVAGDSAGGNLATVTSIWAKEKNGPAISAQLLIYPVTNLDFTTPSYNEFEEGFMLDRDLMKWFGKHYVQDISQFKDPSIAPLLQDDLSNLPPALIVTAEFDVLRDEGQAYAKRLTEAGNVVKEVFKEGLIHGYFSNAPIFTLETEETVTEIAEFLETIKQNV